MAQRAAKSQIQWEKILMTFGRRKRILLAAGLLICSALVVGYAIFFGKKFIPEDEIIRGVRPFSLTQREVSKLAVEAGKGNCAAAYRLAKYHLYSSLELPQAEKYFRLAAKCQDPDALVGLITILRRPENDAEVDELVRTLKKIDRKKGDSASEEVALRRSERTSK